MSKFTIKKKTKSGIVPTTNIFDFNHIGINLDQEKLQIYDLYRHYY